MKHTDQCAINGWDLAIQDAKETIKIMERKIKRWHHCQIHDSQ